MFPTQTRIVNQPVSNGVIFTLGAYCFCSLFVTTVYTLLFENWISDDCVIQISTSKKNFAESLLNFLIVEYTIFSSIFLLLLVLSLNTKMNQPKINKIVNLFIKFLLSGNFLFQCTWLLILFPAFQDDVLPKCELQSKVVIFSLVGLVFHLLMCLITMLILCFFSRNFCKLMLQQPYINQSVQTTMPIIVHPQFTPIFPIASNEEKQNHTTNNNNITIQGYTNQKKPQQNLPPSCNETS